MTSDPHTSHPTSQPCMGWVLLLCINVEHSDYWWAVSCCDTQSWHMAALRGPLESVRKEVCVCVCVRQNMRISLSPQVLGGWGGRSIIIACSRSGSPTVTDLEHTNTWAAALIKVIYTPCDTACGPTVSAPICRKVRMHRQTHTHMHAYANSLKEKHLLML